MQDVGCRHKESREKGQKFRFLGRSGEVLVWLGLSKIGEGWNSYGLTVCERSCAQTLEVLAGILRSAISFTLYIPLSKR